MNCPHLLSLNHSPAIVQAWHSHGNHTTPSNARRLADAGESIMTREEDDPIGGSEDRISGRSLTCILRKDHYLEAAPVDFLENFNEDSLGRCIP